MHINPPLLHILLIAHDSGRVTLIVCRRLVEEAKISFNPSASNLLLKPFYLKFECVMELSERNLHLDLAKA
jgi:hypothetical protein